MKKDHGLWLLFVCGSLLLIGAALASCGQNRSAPDLTPNPTQLAELSVPTITPVPVATNPAAEISPLTFTDVACLNCHTNPDILKGMTSQSEPADLSSYAAWAGQVPSTETWQKVLIDAQAYAADVHAFINCTTCHGGQAVADMTAAHTGLIVDPSADPQKGCATCHPDVVPDAVNSLHYTLTGFNTALHARSSADHYAALDSMVSEQCQSCHATCSDCHVSQPQVVGGGLLAGHQFVTAPLADQTCVGCHGSRIQSEFEGLNPGVPPDVHEQAGMTCTDCHTATELHGTGQSAAESTSRYAGSPELTCESCHADQVGIGSGILMHEIHGTEIIPCQTCHSVSYTNCTNCHVTPTEGNTPSYTLESQTLGFYLGKNPLVNTDRPWRYVPVRHIPIDVNSFDEYGTDLLDSFLSQPTWTYTTPHNIQRLTPQTSGCTSCHGNDDLFLTADKVAEAERAADQQVIVDQAPPLPANWPQVVANVIQRINEETQPAAAPTLPAETFTSYWGVSGPATSAPAPGESSFWGGGPAAPTSAPPPAATGTPPPALGTATPVPAAATGTPAPGESSFWSASPTSSPTSSGSFWGGGSNPTATGTPAPAIATTTPTIATATSAPPTATASPEANEATFWGGGSTPTSTPTAEGGSFWGS